MATKTAVGGFFNLPKAPKKTTKKAGMGITTTGDFCSTCGLDKLCTHPKMPYAGQGRLGILILGENPGKTDDFTGVHNSGESGAVLKKALRMMGLDLEKDFWYDNVCRCRVSSPGKDKKGNDLGMVNREVTKEELLRCRPRYWETIRMVQPKAIFLMGTAAIKSYFLDRSHPVTKDLGATRWRGTAIPDIQTGAWIFPFFDTNFLLKNEDVMGSFKIDLTNALRKVNDVFPPPVDYPSYVRKIKTAKEINHFLGEVIQGKYPLASIDYECSALKPYGEGRHVWTAAVGISDTEAVAFPIDYPGIHTPEEQRVIKGRIKAAFGSGTKWVGHNIQMEERWNRGALGFRHECWHWDTMQAAHILDERDLTCNLDTQVFLHFGYEYGDNISPYKKGNPLNRMHEIPLDELLEYNGLDAYFTLRLYHEQMKYFNYNGHDVEARKTSLRMNQAYKLFHRGAHAFADLEETGIAVSGHYYLDQMKRMGNRIDVIKKQLLNDPASLSFKSKFGRLPDFGESGVTKDLKILVFDIMGVKPKKTTASGAACMDEATMEEFNIPITKNLIKLRKLSKMYGTYLKGFVDEIVDDVMRPNFNLHLTRSYRSSCVAKGTRIETVRDRSVQPEGTPIEEVKVGDLVFAYDSNCSPVIRKVLWAGKTGTKKVVRVHWKGRRGNQGFLDVTPEHKIRMWNGEYVQAKDLMDFDKKKFPKSNDRSVLAVSRKSNSDIVYFTGQEQQLEHRFIYSQCVGELGGSDKVHHKDFNHLNNNPDNLLKMSGSCHSSLHSQIMANTEEHKRRSSEQIKRLNKEGKMDKGKGKGNPLYLSLSKSTFLKALAKAKGLVVKLPWDFSTCKEKAFSLNIDLKKVKDRYDGQGNYRTLARVKKAASVGLSEAQKVLGANYYKTKRLLEERGFSAERKWGNQFGSFMPHNHSITWVEEINQVVDVYDLEVEEVHNFIANEICVHNSDSPNFQNIPKRDNESQLICRNGIVPRPGHFLAEVDYGAMEVRIIACWSQDPVLVKEMLNNEDPHGTWAIELGLDVDQYKWMLEKQQKADPNYGNTLTPEHKKKAFKLARFDAKNAFVFALFYGSYWRSICRSLVERGYSVTEDRVKRTEKLFWGKYKVLKKKYEWAKEIYQKTGKVFMMFGHERRGFLTYNQICNSYIQGPAFHCLLDSFCEINDTRKREGWNTMLRGQIHDAIILDIHPSEEAHVIHTVTSIMTAGMQKRHKEIIVPLLAEWELCKVDEPWPMKKGIPTPVV